MSEAIPSVLKPNFDLFGLDVGENRAFPDKLLPANGTGFGALVIEPLKGFNLLRRVTDIFPVVHHSLTILAGHCHHHFKLKILGITN